MAKSGRRGAPPDLKGTLGTLLRTTINQVGALSDVARRSALTQKQRLDGALLERRRREALADLGEVLYQLLKSGEIELDELPELVQAAEEIEELERRIAEAEAEGARQRRPVRLARTERGSAAGRGSGEASVGSSTPRASERVWRPPDLEALPEPARRASPETAQRPSPVPRPASEPPPAARGGITFVEDDAPDSEELDEYMNEADVPVPGRKRPAESIRRRGKEYRPAVSARAVLALAGFLACSRPPSAPPTGDDGSPPTDAHGEDAGVPPDAGPTGVPDLTLDLLKARADLSLREKFYSLDSCELDADEDCIGGAGRRRLLGFSIRTPNVGSGDLFLGQPSDDNPAFDYSECHDHYHFKGYAEYRLLYENGDEVGVGRKQAFCLLDSERWQTDDPTVATAPKYRCEYQGIQRGWADSYTSHLPCQFIDVTGLPAGTYALEVELNGEHTLVELDYGNNLVSIPIDLDDPSLLTPTEPCPDDIDPAASKGTARECGWTVGPTFDCTPGEIGRVGCSSSCGLGSCTGNPMLRVCDADREDGNCTHPTAVDPSQPGGGESNDFAGPCPCDLSVECPPSGQIQVFTAPFRDGDPYTCDAVFEQ